MSWFERVFGGLAKRRAGKEVWVDETGIHRRDGSGVEWSRLVRIVVFTTDEGPFVEDVFWLFMGVGETGAVIGNGEIQKLELLELGKHLEGFDWLVVAEAMGSTEIASFEVWSGQPGDAEAGGALFRAKEDRHRPDEHG